MPGEQRTVEEPPDAAGVVENPVAERVWDRIGREDPLFKRAREARMRQHSSSVLKRYRSGKDGSG